MGGDLLGWLWWKKEERPSTIPLTEAERETLRKKSRTVRVRKQAPSRLQILQEGRARPPRAPHLRQQGQPHP